MEEALDLSSDRILNDDDSGSYQKVDIDLNDVGRPNVMFSVMTPCSLIEGY